MVTTLKPRLSAVYSSPLWEELTKQLEVVKRYFFQEIQRVWERVEESFKDPEVIGRLVERYIKCGKPTCRCRGGAFHGPYWYLFKLQHGRMTSTYICSVARPNGILQELQQGIANRRYNRRQQRKKTRFIKNIRLLERLHELKRREVKKDYEGRLAAELKVAIRSL